MPAEQRGQVYATAKGFGIRWYDERGARRRQAGFSSPSKARAWFRDVELQRMRGGLENEPLTLREFSDRYLARYEADRAAVTVQTLKWRLVRSLDEFGDVELSNLRAERLRRGRRPSHHRGSDTPSFGLCARCSTRRLPGSIRAEPGEGDRQEREADDRRTHRARTRRRR